MIFGLPLDKYQGKCQASAIFSNYCSSENPNYCFNLLDKDWLAILSPGLPGLCSCKTEAVEDRAKMVLCCQDTTRLCCPLTSTMKEKILELKSNTEDSVYSRTNCP